MKFFGALMFLSACSSVDPAITQKCWDDCFVADHRNPSVCVALCEAETETEVEPGPQP